MVISGKRPTLEGQTVGSLHGNTEHPYRLIHGNCPDPHPADIIMRNSLVDEIDFDYDYLCFVDDDLYFNNNWLRQMVTALDCNPDVEILSAIKWPAHKVLADRAAINITDRMTGGCLLMKKPVWKKYGPFDIHRDKTNLFRERVQRGGGKVAVLYNKFAVVHCGITSLINNKGYSEKTIKNIKALCDDVGAICE